MAKEYFFSVHEVDTAIKNYLKGALNPNFLNLTINREKFWL